MSRMYQPMALETPKPLNRRTASNSVHKKLNEIAAQFGTLYFDIVRDFDGYADSQLEWLLHWEANQCFSGAEPSSKRIKFERSQSFITPYTPRTLGLAPVLTPKRPANFATYSYSSAYAVTKSINTDETRHVPLTPLHTNQALQTLSRREQRKQRLAALRSNATARVPLRNSLRELKQRLSSTTNRDTHDNKENHGANTVACNDMEQSTAIKPDHTSISQTNEDTMVTMAIDSEISFKVPRPRTANRKLSVRRSRTRKVSALPQSSLPTPPSSTIAGSESVQVLPQSVGEGSQEAELEQKERQIREAKEKTRKALQKQRMIELRERRGESDVYAEPVSVSPASPSRHSPVAAADIPTQDSHLTESHESASPPPLHQLHGPVLQEDQPTTQQVEPLLLISVEQHTSGGEVQCVEELPLPTIVSPRHDTAARGDAGLFEELSTAIVHITPVTVGLGSPFKEDSANTAPQKIECSHDIDIKMQKEEEKEQEKEERKEQEEEEEQKKDKEEEEEKEVGQKQDKEEDEKEKEEEEEEEKPEGEMAPLQADSAKTAPVQPSAPPPHAAPATAKGPAKPHAKPKIVVKALRQAELAKKKEEERKRAKKLAPPPPAATATRKPDPPKPKPADPKPKKAPLRPANAPSKPSKIPGLSARTAPSCPSAVPNAATTTAATAALRPPSAPSATKAEPAPATLPPTDPSVAVAATAPAVVIPSSVLLPHTNDNSARLKSLRERVNHIAVADTQPQPELRPSVSKPAQLSSFLKQKSDLLNAIDILRDIDSEPSSGELPLAASTKQAELATPPQSPHALPESYEMSPYVPSDEESSEESEDDDDRDSMGTPEFVIRKHKRKYIPEWSRGAQLAAALAQQTNSPEIFTSKLACNLREIFPNRRKSTKRGSSGRWD